MLCDRHKRTRIYFSSKIQRGSKIFAGQEMEAGSDISNTSSNPKITKYVDYLDQGGDLRFMQMLKCIKLYPSVNMDAKELHQWYLSKLLTQRQLKSTTTREEFTQETDTGALTAREAITLNP